MKEVIDFQTLEEAKAFVDSQKLERTESEACAVHCSWCTNCSGIVGD